MRGISLKIVESMQVQGPKFRPLGSWSNYFCSEWADNYEGLTEQRFNVPMLWESRELPTRCLISIWILMNMNRDWLFFFVIKFQSFHAWYEINVFWLWVLNQCHTVVPSLHPPLFSLLVTRSCYMPLTNCWTQIGFIWSCKFDWMNVMQAHCWKLMEAFLFLICLNKIF